MTTYALIGDPVSTAACATYFDQFETLHRASIASLDQLRHASQVDVVVLASDATLSAEHVTLLTNFVQQGGGFVCAGRALAHGNRARLHGMLGLAEGDWTQPSELIVRVVAPEHPLTARFESRWPLVDTLFRCEGMPSDATALLEVSWQLRRYPVAYLRPLGAGCVVATTLGSTDAALHDPQLVEFLGRAVLYAAEQRAPRPLNVATVGFGAIGREHGDAITATPGLAFAAVCDRNPARVDAARALYPTVQGYGDLAQLAADDAIDLIIVSTPPNTHAAVALDLLRAGKHVVVEKPFCLTTSEADVLIATAQQQQRALTVYQNRRWDADFLAIRQAVQRGAIGDLFQIETFIGGYGHPCDYWHSDAEISGGVFYDWGSHYLDWLLNLVPEPVRQVSATEHKRVWHDVTNADHSTIRLQFAHGVEAEFMHSDIAAALKPKWYVLGTRGAIVAEWRHETVHTRRWSGDLIEERLQAAESPSRVLLYQRDQGDRVHTQELALPEPPRDPFHRNLADHLLLGLPLAVSPQSSRRNIAVMEAATHSARKNGAWIEPQ